MVSLSWQFLKNWLRIFFYKNNYLVNMHYQSWIRIQIWRRRFQIWQKDPDPAKRSRSGSPTLIEWWPFAVWQIPVVTTYPINLLPAHSFMCAVPFLPRCAPPAPLRLSPLAWPLPLATDFVNVHLSFSFTIHIVNKNQDKILKSRPRLETHMGPRRI